MSALCGFAGWLDRFLSEKGVDLEEMIEVEGALGMNLIPVRALADAMKGAPAREQKGIRTMMVKIDFVNGDVRRYLRHLAKAIAL